MGIWMENVDASPPETVYLLESKFEWNGKEMLAGRSPRYGTETFNIERPVGSKAAASELLQLSPYPVLFPVAMQANENDITLQPYLPPHKGTLQVSVRLTSDSAAFRSWLAKGLHPSSLKAESKGIEAEASAWKPALAGAAPKPMTLKLTKNESVVEDGRTIRKKSLLGTYALELQHPVSLQIEMPELLEKEDYELNFGSFSFHWERNRSNPPEVIWPRGKPELGADSTASLSVAPDSFPRNPKSGKRPFWKFWVRGN
jgi:hypothetical protein